MDEMSEQLDDLTDEEKDLLRRAKEQADAEPPEVKQNRAARRRIEREERKVAKKTPGPRAPGIGPDHDGQSVGSTRFADVSARRRRG